MCSPPRIAPLAFSTITNRIWTPVLFIALHPLQGSVFDGNQEHFLWFGAWLGWTIPLLGVQWWLNRRPVIAPSSMSQLPDTQPV